MLQKLLHTNLNNKQKLQLTYFSSSDLSFLSLDRNGSLHAIRRKDDLFFHRQLHRLSADLQTLRHEQLMRLCLLLLLKLKLCWNWFRMVMMMMPVMVSMMRLLLLLLSNSIGRLRRHTLTTTHSQLGREHAVGLRRARLIQLAHVVNGRRAVFAYHSRAMRLLLWLWLRWSIRSMSVRTRLILIVHHRVMGLLWLWLTRRLSLLLLLLL